MIALALAGLWAGAGRLGGWLWALAAAGTGLTLAWGGWIVRKVLRWRLGSCVRSFLASPGRPDACRTKPGQVTDVCFLFVDHFEPDYGGAGPADQLARVRRWEANYARAVEGHLDTDGRPPQHTWFFPISQNDPEVGRVLSSWPARGWGEMEYHLHHDAEPDLSPSQIERRIVHDLEGLKALGALSGGRYGFVHGMFALAGGDGRYCRCAGELDVLQATGCYADFTFPSLGSPAQTGKINSIYYARSTGRERPYGTGQDAAVGRRGQGLLLINGPMHFGLYSRVCDDAHVEPNHLPSARRIGRWLDCGVHVAGRPNWLFIAVHSHTARDDAQDALFGGAMQGLWSALEERFQRRRLWRLHYVTAREAYNIVRAAEEGLDGNAGLYRDFELPPPPNRRAARLDGTPPSPSGGVA